MDIFFQRYMDSWHFNGWLLHDIILAIVVGVGILLLLYLLGKRRKIGMFVMVFILYAFISNIIMITFGLAGRSFPINSVSSVYTDQSEKIAVQMIKGSENNGTAHGITQIIPHYQMVAINLNSGEKQWTKSSANRTTLIGTFMGGLLVHHYDDENGKLSLLDIQTGKEKLSKEEFTKKHKHLIDILGNTANRLAILHDKLYLEGIDGKYYQYDGKKLRENIKAEGYLSTFFFVETAIPNYFASHDQPLDFEDYEEISKYMNDVLMEPSIQPFANLEAKVLDVDLKYKTAIVSYRKTKQPNAEQILLFYDMKQHRIIWEENIGKVNSEQQNPGVRVLKHYFAIQAGDEFALLDKKTGKEILRYELRWNRPVM
ncbi:hypothetical protein J6TS1_49900 [Siminovitchia terrae]|uniref:Uncharacterized protein n=1 Tax=Siminovitchia terrae TaxID=1914933 RepID=A0ABQ4L5F1_SIMTE|nr:PA2928 family protein [Siminovitchia terrae]GIN99120.1 hypothetical protein J6TS1_49900 [Siminovitchia terrae]